jgi:hypothetical protein
MVVKPRLAPPLNGYQDVGIAKNGMGVLMLGILMEGKAVMTNIPQMEALDEMDIDGLIPMALTDNKEDITGCLLKFSLMGLKARLH